MRGKTLFLCSLLLGASFAGGTMIGQKTVKKLQTGMVPVPTSNTEYNENVSVLSQTALAETPSPSPSPKKTKSTYFLVLSDKEISVYELPPSGDAVFLFASDVEIDQLRQEDYERLCRGIKVGSLEEARALTEDFGS